MTPQAGTLIRPWLVSVVPLRPATGEVLLMERTQTLAGAWCQVAGKVEPGETAWRAALRELREEAGLTPERFYSADFNEQFYEPDIDLVVIAPVFVALVADDAPVTLNHEHSDHRWLSFDAACGTVSFAGQRRMLRHVEAEFFKAEPNPLLEIDIEI